MIESVCLSILECIIVRYQSIISQLRATRALLYVTLSNVCSLVFPITFHTYPLIPPALLRRNIGRNKHFAKLLKLLLSSYLLNKERHLDDIEVLSI